MKFSFSEEDSFQVIEQMIAQVKQKPRKIDSFNTLLWGYLVFIAAMSHWVLLRYFTPERAALAWLILLLGGIVSIWVNTKFQQTQSIKTYIDSLIRQLWQGFGIAFAIVCFMKPDNVLFLPIVMVLYGLAMWMQGALIRFRPYQVGALGCFLCGAIAFYLTNDQQLLILALAVFVGYLLPGHFLLYEIRRNRI